MNKLKLWLKSYVFLYQINCKKEITEGDLKDLIFKYGFKVEGFEQGLTGVNSSLRYIGTRDGETER